MHRSFFSIFTRLLSVSLILTGFVVAVEDPAFAKRRDKAKAEPPPATTPSVESLVLEKVTWREVGPYRGGRSAAVAGLPSQPDVYYFGATGGGVWKTTDGGRSWENVSDGFFGGSIGAVAVSQWDPNVIYVGGGEKTVRGNVSHGDGVWKSTDAGATWSHVGLGDSRRIPRIRIHPKDPDRIYVAALGHLFGPNQERGIYRSKDGGESWEQVLFVNDQVGAVDLALDPTNPRILYACFWRILRTPYSLSSGGPGSGIWKSTDGGDSWEELTENPGMPEGPIGISGITVSPANPLNLYAIIEAEEGGVFRSRDGGKTWKRTNKERSLRQRAWYYSRLYADPADEDSVYVVNVRFHHSKDGGKTFSQIATPHGDNHDLWIAPDDPLRMIQSNDGGANVSVDGGNTWTVQSNQPTAQFYRVSTDNDFPYRLLGGQQDNSAVRIRSRSAFGGSISARDWEPTAGGESGHIVAKPDDPDIVYGGSYGGFLTWVNHRTGERRAVNVWPDDPMGWGAADLKYRFNWNFPLLFSPHDPNRLYAAGNALFASDDGGTSWQALSGDLTRNDKSKMESSGGPITKDNTSVEYYGTLFAIAESQHEPGVLWTGSDDGRVHVSRNGGADWTDVTPKGMPEWSQVNSLEVSPFEPGGMYLAANRYKLDDFRPYLYKTTDYGATWSPIVSGIGAKHFTRALRADPQRPGLLYAGTESGVYVSLNDGRTWQPLQGNLPIVPITDLAVKENDLVAATQGRGFWILDDLTPLHQLPGADGELGSTLFAPRPAYRISTRRNRNPGNAGTNPLSGAVFHYLLAEEPAQDEEMKLEIFDGEGALLRTFTRKPPEGKGDAEERVPGQEDLALLPSAPGLNRFAWDLSVEPAKSFKGMVLWNRRLGAVRALPGKYRASLAVGEWTADTEFEVKPDPRSSSSPADLAEQAHFVSELRDTLTQAHEAITRLRSVQADTKALVERLGEGEEFEPIRQKAKELGESLTAVEEALYQSQNRSPQDPLNFPIRLTDKLAGLMGQAGVGNYPPTTQARQVAAELTQAIEERLSELATVLEEEVPALNALAREKNVPAISEETTGSEE